jgi:toxin ParE1/3/4
MPRYILAPNAQQDLIDIWEYTSSKWGEIKADQYILGLHQKLEILAENPKLGTPREEIFHKLRSHQHRRHTVFYQIGKDCIEILGFIPAGMDIDGYFQKSTLTGISE